MCAEEMPFNGVLAIANKIYQIAKGKLQEFLEEYIADRFHAFLSDNNKGVVRVFDDNARLEEKIRRRRSGLPTSASSDRQLNEATQNNETTTSTPTINNERTKDTDDLAMGLAAQKKTENGKGKAVVNEERTQPGTETEEDTLK